MSPDNTIGRKLENQLKDGQSIFDQPVFDKLFDFLPDDYFTEDVFRGRGVLIRMALTKRRKNNLKLDTTRRGVKQLMVEARKRVAVDFQDEEQLRKVADEIADRLKESTDLRKYLSDEFLPFYSSGNKYFDRLGGANENIVGGYRPPSFEGFISAHSSTGKYIGLQLEVPGDSTGYLRDPDYRRGIRK